MRMWTFVVAGAVVFLMLLPMALAGILAFFLIRKIRKTVPPVSPYSPAGYGHRGRWGGPRPWGPVDVGGGFSSSFSSGDSAFQDFSCDSGSSDGGSSSCD